MYQRVASFLKKRDDSAVSPVIGTILMVAVTVILGATVYAAVGVFGSKTAKEPSDAILAPTAYDSNGNARTDQLRLVLTGGSPVSSSEVRLVVMPMSGSTPVFDSAEASHLASSTGNTWPSALTATTPATIKVGSVAATGNLVKETPYKVTVFLQGKAVVTDKVVVIEEPTP